MLLNYVVQIVFISCMWYFFGVKPIVYLILSLFFSVGLHPLGARWIQEHYVVHKNQETYSYYGILNTVSFNVGYHNEHHDFPSVPWNKLPQIKHKAGPYYTSLVSHSSWTKLFFRFLFDREISLYSRITRSNRGKVKLIDETKPDVEIINYGHELSSK
jgi:sphingolipid delta-4 desaturase